MESVVETRKPVGHEDYLELWSGDGCHQNPFDDATRLAYLLSQSTISAEEVRGAFDELLRQLGQSHNAALRWEMTHVIHRTCARRSLVMPADFMNAYLRIASADRYDYVFAGFERALCDQLERGSWRALTRMVASGLETIQAAYEDQGGKERLVATKERLGVLEKELRAKLKKREARARKEIAAFERRTAEIANLLMSRALSDGARENFEAEILEIDDDIRDRKKDIANGFPCHFSSLRKTVTELAGVVRRLSTMELQIRRHQDLLTKYTSS